MNNQEFTICLISCLVSVGGGALLYFRYYTRRFKALSDRIDKLVLQIEKLEMEREKLEK